MGHHSTRGHHPHHHPRRVEDTRVVARPDRIDRVDDVDVDVDGRECATRERRGASTMRNAWNRCRRRRAEGIAGNRGVGWGGMDDAIERDGRER